MIADDIDTLDPQELRERLRKVDAQLVPEVDHRQAHARERDPQATEVRRQE
ncbi:hypothetical protein ACEN9J_38680 [Variovorax sp. Varisp41]|uniref:hypothetical protein n=1 Tax=Variovorax sp. Varisp41 TaxID=3243033 RepID=UPI0039B6425F